MKEVVACQANFLAHNGPRKMVRATAMTPSQPKSLPQPRNPSPRSCADSRCSKQRTLEKDGWPSISEEASTHWGSRSRTTVKTPCRPSHVRILMA